MDIITMIDQLASIKSQIDDLALDMQEKQDALLTDEIRAQLNEIAAEYDPMIYQAQANADALEAQIKEMVINVGATVKGSHMQAVYMKGRVQWDAKALDGYAMNVPELFAFRKEGSPSASIRWNK